ncbi:hypothetical protein A3B42_01370 [Candidatus Daviesbacteria bacterium RIFCSPLOWO2_01_FULL_38_10]|nr:MAG: hypothetical protein US80_C0008G0011 [Candidatus Daviesbacteria bacterium GW2011_GWA2_38_17]OGE38373.1 MAG: hypothetical protein A3B42_01370 [Candidatus Daviesbacteria bacterium RIFCSPLOWO2_01_FULL_38_10]OGE45924.1 MAG: hypothetical protein A3E67_01550 [Candidatus Daviesbacteria bacterium RIFCSPHIGHO2_12_FULL_38_25]OGE68804.1 MAG: hypothetical protein A3H81_04510 [Candidatus Daviesbacteria bacterium RIFCSPLOWO2_02_FULL_38_18]OGE72566.1 MAG: hypothetical protein A3H18_02645 [Candidatus D
MQETMRGRWTNGYALAQQEINEVCWVMDGSIDGSGETSLSLKRRVAGWNAYERNVTLFLNWVKQSFRPRIFYYPMCGWHITPREVFGKDSVVHLSNDMRQSFLNDIEEGIRVRGDIYRQPFKAGVFEVVYLRGQDLPRWNVARGMIELRRVVKDDGIFVIELMSGTKNIARYAGDHMQPASIPDDVRSLTERYFSLYVNRSKEPEKRLWLPQWFRLFGRKD